MLRLTDKGRADGGLVIRTARKGWGCAGNGAGNLTQWAPGCGEIDKGEPYLECLWSAPAFQSGSRHCVMCAVAFFPGWVDFAAVTV
jgi:hypothetical protein